MSSRHDRRRFLQASASAGALVGLGDVGFLAGLQPVTAAEARLDPQVVALRPEIEPLVRLLEETPRDRLLEEVAARIRGGLSYRELLAALLLAGVKNVEPRPSVGFKFHAVLVVNSAHLASISSPPDQRWLPIFWALDYFKSAAARDVAERGDWSMSAVDESALPSAANAHDAFRVAMDDWDEAAADVAVSQLTRTAGANEIYEMLFRYGARDFRSIGHKAIYVANSWRTLQCIGWQHAEPVLRSLAYALLMHEGDSPALRDADADRPYRRNEELAGTIRDDWRDGRLDPAATQAMIEMLRSASNEEACDHVVQLLNRGIATATVWDALHSRAAEMLMQQPGIVALHAVTTTNALYFAFQTSGDDRTRRLLLLQNAAFLPMFRAAMQARGKVGAASLEVLKSEVDESEDVPDLEDIFATVSRDPAAASRQVLAYLNRGGNAQELIDAARVLVFLKGDDAHDYKFSSAVLEDYYHITPEWRNAYLAANMFKLHGSGGSDNPVAERTRAALVG